MYKRIILGLLFVIVLPLAASAQLTGVWQGNDGADYYIRQVGSEIWWLGENDPVNPTFSNVAHGKIHGNLIILSWGDVPKGSNQLSGVLVLRVVSSRRLEAIRRTGGFGGSVWTR